MSGLAVILVPAGFIAALICFRWARWLAVAAVVFTVLWLAGRTHNAHAQASPIVQCRIGAFSAVMPDYACVAMTHAATKLMFGVTPMPGADYTGVRACAADAGAQMGLQPYAMVGECNAIWREMVTARIRR